MRAQSVHAIPPCRAQAICWLLCCLLLCMTRVEAIPFKSLRFEHVGREQGFQHESVQAMLQDRQGFMWFGTQGGLHRYDGTRVIFYRHDPTNKNSLADNWVWALFQDPQGRMWVGTRNGGLHRYDAVSEGMVRYPRPAHDSRGSGSNQIQAIESDGARGMWLATGDGLVHFDPDTGRFQTLRHDANDPNSLSNDNVQALARDTQGNLWVGTANGLNLLPEGSRQFLRYRMDDPMLPDTRRNSIQSLLQDRGGRLWIGSMAGLEVWNGSQPQRMGEKEDFPAGPVSALLEDKAGVVWAGTDDGVRRWDPGIQRFIAYRHHPSDVHSLSNNRVTRLLQDRSGTLWVGTWFSGASRANLASGGFERMQHLPGESNTLSNNTVSSVTGDTYGHIWLATNGGLNRYHPPSGEIRVFKHSSSDPRSLSNDKVRVLLPAEGVRLWVGTQDGLNLFDPRDGSAQRYYHDPANPHSLSANTIHALARDKQGRLWVGSEDGLNCMLDESGRFQRYNHDPNNPHSLSHARVVSVLFDRRGQMWVGNFGGLDRYDPKTGRFEHFRHDPNDPHSLSHSRVYQLFEDREGGIWVGTASGLNYMLRGADGKIRFRRFAGDLGNDATAGINQDDNGHVWVSTDGGLYKLGLDHNLERRFFAADGLIDGSFTVGASYRDMYGNLYFGGFQGLNWFDPAAISAERESPPTTITDFLILNQSVRGGQRPPGFDMQGPISEAKEVTLSHRHTVFSIEFAALHFRDPQHYRYAYMLEGFDKDWVQADASRRYATYTNLEPGQYIFRVKAASKGGTWNEDGARLVITITPPFWLTWWFRLVLALSLLSLAYLAYRLRVRHFARQNLMLEKLVAERSAEAQRERKRLQDLTEALPLSVFQFRERADGTRDYAYVSENVVKVLGVSAQELLQDRNTRWRYVLPEDYAKRKIISEAALDERRSVNFLQRVEFDGRVRWVHTHTVPPKLIDGDWVWNGFWMDETENQLQQEELRAAKELAEAATVTKSHFLANMSHEIRTPMNAIIGLSHLVKKTALNHQQRDYIDKIHNAGSSLLGIINDILDFSKIEAGKLDIEATAFHLERLIDAVFSLLAHSRQEKDISLELDIAADVPRYLIGDPLRLRQILTNLLSNAIKFTARGSVVLSVCRRTSEHSGTTDAACLQFSVRDSGIGMSQEQQQKLFQAFTQADSSTTRKYGGTGLGLTISRHLVELMGGRIWVESEEGKGSCFHFYACFSAASEEGQSGAEIGKLLQDADLRGLAVLLAEDNPINQQIARELMQAAGIVVSIADNGRIALEKLATAELNAALDAGFDLVLMDLQMPEMDGYATTAAIRAHPEWQHLPVIAMTAHALTVERERCLQAGMNDHISKPIDPDLLFAVLLRWGGPRLQARRARGAPMPPAETAVPDTEAPEPGAGGEGTLIPVLAAAGIASEGALRRCGGNHGLYLSLLQRFVQTQADTPQRIAGALQQQDHAQARLLAHSLRGVAANIGAVEVAALAAELEYALQAGEPAPDLLQRFSLACAACCKLLQSLLLGDATPYPSTPAEGDTIQDWQTRLSALQDLLENDDAEALDFLQQTLPALRAQAVLSEADVQALQEAVNNFEFEAALKLLRQYVPQ